MYLRWFGTRVRVCLCVRERSVRERSVREHSVFEERSVREHVFELCSRQGLEGYIRACALKVCSSCVRIVFETVFERRSQISNCVRVCSSSLCSRNAVFECVRVFEAVFGSPFQQFHKKVCSGTLVFENACSRTRVRAVFEPFVFDILLFVEGRGWYRVWGHAHMPYDNEERCC